jgi:nucleoside-triphosphatase
MRMIKNILVTGPPGCGKSTLIEKVVAGLRIPVVGFFTWEIREGDRRVGFSIETVQGKKGILAHVKSATPFRVGKYFVLLDSIDQLAVPALIAPSEEALVVIDEIGKMECFSSLFREAVLGSLDSPNPVLGSIALRGDAFMNRVKTRPDVILLMLTPANRDELVLRLGEAFTSSNLEGLQKFRLFDGRHGMAEKA